MIKPYVRKRLISRRDLTSFGILLGCGANAGSKDHKTTDNKNITASNGSTSNSKTKRIRLSYTTFGDLTREKFAYCS
ncbi:MAG: hypothetical protein DSM106950_20880 [Stigonema ocellatum SAG 48.90 = DSM 106950]|nr:hypothetical protein [Stigonema ocellatum SAG 48.90 = DSM 106950]